MTGTPSLWARCRRATLEAILVAIILAGALAAPSGSEAQIGTGVLTGRVTDASTNAPLVDVVVIATSPAAQGEQLVVTDSTGTYRIPTLPPGEYTLSFQADTFKPYSRLGINVTGGTTLRANAQLLPETLSAKEVTVVASAPTVDVGSTRSGVTINNDFTSRVPVAPPSGKGGAARSFEQLGEIAPTGRSDDYGSSLSGTTSVENQYLIDGISSGDPGYGYNAQPLSIDFIKEANIITGGYLPEYGKGGGGVFDVVTKSGSNEFHGSVFGNLTPWQAQPKIPTAQDAISTYSRLDSVRDLGFELGGPIIKDKLWFYVGGNIAQQSFDLNRSLNVLSVGADGKYTYNSDGLINSSRIPGTQRDYLAEQTAGQYLTKLTWAPGPNDRVELIHRGTPSRGGGDGKYSVDYETGAPLVFANPNAAIAGTYSATAWRQVFDAYTTSLKWTHNALNKRLTFDTTIGWMHERTANLASDGTALGGGGLSATPLYTFNRTTPQPHPITDFETLPNPGVCVNPVAGGDAVCPTAQYAVGGPQILQDRTYDRLQGREVATFVANALGHHVVKAGVEFEYMGFDSQAAYPGGPFYQERAPGTSVNDYRRLGGLTSPNMAYTIDVLRYKLNTVSAGAFLQDSWSIMDKVTLNAGLRYDTQSLYADQGKGLVLPNMFSPRVGFIFDPTFAGKAKLFANYAIYYQSMPLAIMSRAGSGEPSVRSRRSIDDCNPLAGGGYPQSCENPDGLISINTPPNDKWVYTGGTGRLAVDPDLKPQSSSEFSTGGEWEIIPNGRLGVTYIRRWMNNVIEDMSRDEASTYFLGNPGKGIASDFPSAERTYDAGILSFTKTFASNWLAQSSYTLSHLRGNWEGLYRAQTGQLDPGTNSDFDLRSLVVNRKGDLAGDRRHEFKMFGAYEIPLHKHHHINIGGAYRTRSGAPTNVLGAHPLYGTDEVFILPRGAGQRMPWVHNIDLHVGYTFFKNKTQTVAVTMDIFNLFNFRSIVQRSERYTVRDVEATVGTAANGAFTDSRHRTIDPIRIAPADGGDPFDNGVDRNRAFGAPVRYQDPISMRFGVKSTF